MSFSKPHTDRDIVGVATTVTKTAVRRRRGQVQTGRLRVQAAGGAARTGRVPDAGVPRPPLGDLAHALAARAVDEDLALDQHHRPLGSCTMKLNAAAEVEPISWPEFASVHPGSRGQTAGWGRADRAGCRAGSRRSPDTPRSPSSRTRVPGASWPACWPSAATRWTAASTSAKPILIPSWPTAPTPASAVLASLEAWWWHRPGRHDQPGRPAAKTSSVGDELAGIVVTYPPPTACATPTSPRSAPRGAADAAACVDGANLNTFIGLARPAAGGDIFHLNLHKTFCIRTAAAGPAWAGGHVAEAPHALPAGNPATASLDERGAGFPVARRRQVPQACCPSASMCIAMTGARGWPSTSRRPCWVRTYISAGSRTCSPRSTRGAQAGECRYHPWTCAPMTKASGVAAEDVCKRLSGLRLPHAHARVPVAGLLMVGGQAGPRGMELSRFIEAMRTIHAGDAGDRGQEVLEEW
ncbi:hypothetical protein QJS66_20275 [Kocuria rhizophila]|nr:hypothetical protein QJS66_20275 [Kocuria rhizophila]